MIIAINDLSFMYMFNDFNGALNGFESFLDICIKIESGRCHSADKIMVPDINMSYRICPSDTLYGILDSIKDRDKKRYCISLFTNRKKCTNCGDVYFVFDNLKSKLCYEAKEGFVISMKTKEEFGNECIEGSIEGVKVSIKNIANMSHFELYGHFLGIRKYVANSIKHKKDTYTFYGGRKPGSPMDLFGEEAQALLDRSVLVKGRLYAKKNGKYYCFMHSGNSEYHGLINEDLTLDIKREIDRERWD